MNDERSGANAGEDVPEDGRVLDGVLVVELGQRVGSAVCGSLLAQLGATVVCVEHPDGTRADTKWTDRPQLAAGKLSLVPDGPSERTLLVELLRRCDVIITSADIDRLRLGDDGLPAAPPDAIVCDVTAFGVGTDPAMEGCSELQIQALTGVLDTTGHADGPPSPITIPLIEHVSGTYAAGAVLCALRLRRTRGVSQAVEIALYDVGFSLLTSFLPVVLDGGPHPPVTRVGNRQTMVAPWNVYRAKDGWLLLCAGSDEQWRRICQVIGRHELGSDPLYAKASSRLARVAEVDAIVSGWVVDRTVDACVDRFCEVSIPCGPIVRIGSSPDEPNLRHREMIKRIVDPVSGRVIDIPGSPLRMSRSPGLPPARLARPGGDHEEIQAILGTTPKQRPILRGSPEPPLAGLRVIEVGHYTTAPLAARHLANLGAEVVKVEPPDGEAVRRWPPARNGQGIFFSFQNADKKSVVIDMDTKQGKEEFRVLISSADVLIENLKPGSLAKRGFGQDELLAINSRLVSCAISGFGQDSLYPGRPAFDAVIQAMSGLMDVVQGDGMPLKTGPSSADIMGAVAAFLAIVAALEYRDRTGLGQSLDLSMQDLGAWSTQCAWNKPAGGSTSSFTIAAQDGYVLAEPEPHLAPLVDVARERAEAQGLTREECAAFLASQFVRTMPIRTVEEVVKADWTRARKLWFSAGTTDETFPLLASPIRLQLTPARVVVPGPPLGRDTAEVMGRL